MKKPGRRKPLIIYFMLFAIISAAALYALLNSAWVKRMQYPLLYEEHISKYANEYGLDQHLVASVIWVESKYNPDAISRRDARGLMQVLPETARWGAEKMGLDHFDDSQLYDPEMNIRIGCWYLAYLKRQFPDSHQLILASYNGGIGNVKKWLKDKAYSSDGQTLDNIPFRETREYVSLVLKTYNIYKDIYPTLKAELGRN